MRIGYNLAMSKLENSFNETLIAMLDELNRFVGYNIDLLKLTPTDIFLGNHNFQGDLVSEKTGNEINMKGNFSFFLESISKSIIRLNHLGISYFCEDIEKEIALLKKVTASNDLPLYEEKSGFSSQKWLFTGDFSNWQNSLFEIVLNKGNHIKRDYWRPHFQIDIDTSLSIDEIKKMTDKYLEKDFIRWQLDIPDYGTVLAMGVLGEVNGTKIALGIGTSLRDTEYHRKHLQNPI